MCDVRDVALAHIRVAHEKRATGGLQSDGTRDKVEKHRFIISSKRAVRIPAALAWLRDEYTDYEIVEGGVIQPPSQIIFCPKNAHVIGMEKLRPPKESLLDMAKAMLALKSVVPVMKQVEM
jgi:hypothetical protein